MQYSEVIGQEKLKQSLRDMVDSGRSPHALLFAGPRGSGNLALAIAYCQYLMCDQKTEDDSCGICPSCTKVAKLIHPDLHFTFPTVGSKAISSHFLKQWREMIANNPYMDYNAWMEKLQAENKQGNITTEECNDIIRRLNLKSFESAYKVQIIWLPEFLQKEGNRLLKLIEEPPEKTVFILVAEDIEKILNTILSRCQLVKINALDDDSMVAGLKKLVGLEESEARTITHLADGNFNEALTLARHDDNDQAALFLDWFRACFKGHPKGLFEIVERLSAMGRERQKHFMQYSLFFLREMVVLLIAGNSDHARLRGKELEAAKKLSALLAFEQVDQVVEIINQTYYHVERNANPRILFMDTCIQIHKAMKAKTPV